jgi:pyridinium-3,5-bisthiocarboxylic acid mononucleotide nickel chelatase
MKIAYFDCFSGISGDMILGAFIELGLDLGKLTDHLSKMKLGGYMIAVSREKRGPISGTRLNIQVAEDKQPHRSMAEIRQIIGESKLPGQVKKTSLAILERLARVEGNLHQQSAEDVHFHEIGAVDSIVDMVGACIGLHLLDIKKVVASPLPLGRGFVQCQHGMLPLPAPATLALLEETPVYDSGQQREMVTPTGAAILTTICSEYGGFPTMSIAKVGYGVGRHPEDHPPNLLRVVLGQTNIEAVKERLLMVETSIDDMNPELYGHLMEQLLSAGGLDVNVLPAQMKKNRPGQLLRVLVPEGLRETVLQILFSETTTLGVRIQEVERYSLPRHSIRVQTPFGTLPVKVAANPQGNYVFAPEYDACQRAARKHQVPLRQVYEEAMYRARKRLSKDDKKKLLKELPHLPPADS